MTDKTAKILEDIYQKLFKHFGPQHWWPGETPFEVIIGSILTQNTAWSNVEKAIKNLKNDKILSPLALKKIPLRRLAKLIRSSGYYNQKSKKIKNFINFLYSRYNGSLAKMFKKDYLELRSELLTIKGIGLETADSILLYAACKPIFVVDAYTKRILLRHNILSGDENYSAIQNIFMDSLRGDVQLFNEYHALLVKLGKSICKTKPNCLICPLNYPPSQKSTDLPVDVLLRQGFEGLSPEALAKGDECEELLRRMSPKRQAHIHLADNPPKLKAKALQRRRVKRVTTGLPTGFHLFEEKGYVCDSCNKTFTVKEARYLAKIELYASPDIEFSDEDLRKDTQKELKSLIEELKNRDAKELEEDVYILYKFNLCKNCRDIFNQRLKHKEFV